MAARLVPAIQLPSLAGELSLCLFLLARGVDEARSRERASAAATWRRVPEPSR